MSKDHLLHRLLIGGSGGQGIMLLGKLIAEAALRENRQVTWLPAYGPEVRGGAAHCLVIISDEAIGSPYAAQVDVLIAMNGPSQERYYHRLKERGLLMVNTSLAEPLAHPADCLLAHPFTDVATGLGNIRVANVVALGCYLARTNICALATMHQVIADVAPVDRQELVPVNQQALEKGASLK